MRNVLRTKTELNIFPVFFCWSDDKVKTGERQVTFDAIFKYIHIYSKTSYFKKCI